MLQLPLVACARQVGWDRRHERRQRNDVGFAPGCTRRERGTYALYRDGFAHVTAGVAWSRVVTPISALLLMLPNSGLRVSYSTRHYRFGADSDAAVQQDQHIEPDWQDFRSGRDPVLDWILAQPIG
jgi:hypothetical protein